jgi:regulator of nucleoside diphosphate kinase
MKERRIYVTACDFERLGDLVSARARRAYGRDDRIAELEAALGRAEVLPSHEFSADVVTMYSAVRLVDLDAGREFAFTLVFPDEAEIGRGMISVLAPLGSRTFGLREGDVIDWRVPGGARRMRILQVLSPPELALGDPVHSCEICQRFHHEGGNSRTS